jgi:IS5 family transposase
VLRETDPQASLSLWEALLPEEARQPPTELAAVDAYLDDERFLVPWRALFDRRLGRPSVPVDTLLRLLYLKHRYGLGYESWCREVADSISWRRFCRIGLDRPVPHPTTLVKLVRRAGPDVIEQLNTALVAKLTGDKLLRARKLRVDTTVVEADIDYPTDADLLEQAVRKVGGLVRRIRAAGRPAGPDSATAAGRLGGGCSSWPAPCGAAVGWRWPSGPAHRPGRDDRSAHPARGPGGGRQRPAGAAASTRRRAACPVGRRAGRDDHCHPAAAGPDRPAPGRQPGDR